MSKDESAIPVKLRLMAKIPTFLNNLARRKDHTINRRFAELYELKSAANPKGKKGVSSRDVTVNKETGTWVRIFAPVTQTHKSLPLVIYYHGGGFAALSPAFFLYHIFCSKLAKKGSCVVVSVHYRRSPEHKYPAAHEDSFEVLKWLQGTKELPENTDLARCFLMGDSAGGNLVHFVGCRAAEEDLKPISIKGHVLIQPYFGGEERTPAEIRLIRVPIISVEAADWHWKAYLGEHENRDHPVCNVFGPRSDGLPAVGLPPSLVIVGEHDPLEDWQIRYAEGLEKGGHTVAVKFYKGAIHAFHIFYHFRLSQTVFTDICFFLDDH